MDKDQKLSLREHQKIPKKEQKEYPFLFFNLGTEHRKKGNLNEAARCLLIAAEADAGVPSEAAGNDYGALMGKDRKPVSIFPHGGFVDQKKDSLELAKKSGNKKIKAKAAYNMGLRYQRAGDYENARKQVAEARSINPALPELRQRQGRGLKHYESARRLIEDKRYDEAIDYLNEAINLKVKEAKVQSLRFASFLASKAGHEVSSGRGGVLVNQIKKILRSHDPRTESLYMSYLYFSFSENAETLGGLGASYQVKAIEYLKKCGSTEQFSSSSELKKSQEGVILSKIYNKVEEMAKTAQRENSPNVSRKPLENMYVEMPKRNFSDRVKTDSRQLIAKIGSASKRDDKLKYIMILGEKGFLEEALYHEGILYSEPPRGTLNSESDFRKGKDKLEAAAMLGYPLAKWKLINIRRSNHSHYTELLIDCAKELPAKSPEWEKANEHYCSVVLNKTKPFDSFNTIHKNNLRTHLNELRKQGHRYGFIRETLEKLK